MRSSQSIASKADFDYQMGARLLLPVGHNTTSMINAATSVSHLSTLLNTDSQSGNFKNTFEGSYPL